MRRVGMLIGLKADKVTEYKALHASVWPDVLAALSGANICNFTIFLREPENLLFGYFEYHGSDYTKDMAVLAALPSTQRWAEVTGLCQEPLSTCADGEQWSTMNEVFHLD